MVRVFSFLLAVLALGIGFSWLADRPGDLVVTFGGYQYEVTLMVAAVVVVVHLPPDKESLLAGLFAPRCVLAVKEAEDKEPLLPATIYFAPPNYHLLIESDLRLSLSSDEAVRYSRPSIDVLFESAADACGDALTGVILTGSNCDGAIGLRAVCDQSLAFGAGLIRDAQASGALRPGFSASDLARIFAVNAYLVRDRPAGDDGWRRTLQFTLDGLRAQPDSTSQ